VGIEGAQVIRRAAIEAALPGIDVISQMESAFVAYSEDRAVVPPVGELLFANPPGDAHIKYGYLKGDDIFLIKVACGFYENPSKGLPANSGLMVTFDQRTGLPLSVLLDEGLLTNVRTAAAGAVAAKHLARRDTQRICVLGSGVQARLQMQFLAKVTPCREVSVWARKHEAAEALARDLLTWGYRCVVEASPAAAARHADIVITATAATSPLLQRDDVRPGVHITAMGSDTAEKQELSADLLARADVVVADSRAQCVERGEIHHAVAAGLLQMDRVAELGEIIAGRRSGRIRTDQITVADLTGVAVQDIAIAKAVLSATKSTAHGAD
jgi:ornithine cyclodeaminase